MPKVPVYYKRTTMEEERQAWIEACLLSLCAAYQEDPLILGVETPEYCLHPWCIAVVDVLRRAIGGA